MKDEFMLCGRQQKAPMRPVSWPHYPESTLGTELLDPVLSFKITMNKGILGTF